MKKSVAIIGGGLSGTLVVLNILKTAKEPIHLFWFDEKKLFCKGLAYSTLNTKHLLNVRASNMSLFKDDANHFVTWLQNNNETYTPTDFVPRQVFATYVEHTLRDLETLNPFVSISKLSFEVTSVNKQNSIYILNNNENIKTHAVVLALGNFLPSNLAKNNLEYTTSPFYIRNAFSTSLTNSIQHAKHITILGSGLTMLDLLLTLNHQNYQGNITVISPHGITPVAQLENPLPPVQSFLESNYAYTLIQLFGIIKWQLKQATQNNLNPFSVIDLMRPHLQFIWTHFSLSDKQQFLRHLRHKWGVVRHRAPATTLALVEKYQTEKKLQIVKGRVQSIIATKNAAVNFSIKYKTTALIENEMQTDVIINCTGPEANLHQCDSMLIKQLLQDNLITVDALNYGLNATINGMIDENLYALGPLLKGILWESTAIPEIRVQAHYLAHELLKNPHL